MSQRRPAIAISGVDGGADIQQRAHAGVVPALRGQVEGRAAGVALNRRNISARIQQRLDAVCVASVHSAVQRGQLSVVPSIELLGHLCQRRTQR